MFVLFCFFIDLIFSLLLWQLPALENQYSDTIQTNHCHLIASVKYHHASAKTFVCNNVSSNKQLAKTDLVMSTKWLISVQTTFKSAKLLIPYSQLQTNKSGKIYFQYFCTKSCHVVMYFGNKFLWCWYFWHQ